CPGMAAEILLDITDVTGELTAAGAGLEGQAFNEARNAAAARLEAEACGEDATLRCQVISFYRGGQYGLYKFRKYDDVRLAFAPEFQAAFFGGDPDNFNFPRYALDGAFLRLYEDGRPVATPTHLTWNPAPPTAGEPVFVAGNPGSTERLLTVSQLETLRDLTIPIGQLQRSELRGRLISFADRSEEHARVALDPLFGLENSFKVFYGRQFVLNDAAFMDAKAAEEAQLRAAVAANPALQQRIGDPWSEIEQAQTATEELYLPYRQLEQAAGGGSQLYRYARALVRNAVESQKPSGERLPEYADARQAQLERSLTTEIPISPELEELYLGFWLSKTREYLTVDHPAVRGLLGRENPEGLARRLVAGSTLADPAVRR